jgi:outer membrane biogenesis lipoprotein LolB
MAMKNVMRSTVLGVTLLLAAASASQAGSADTAAADAKLTLVEKKFQQTVRHYQKYQHEGQVVYCRKEKVVTSAIPAMQCVTESALRLRVEESIRSRNAVQPALAAGAGQGGIG